MKNKSVENMIRDQYELTPEIDVTVTFRRRIGGKEEFDVEYWKSGIDNDGNAYDQLNKMTVIIEVKDVTKENF